MHSMRYRFLLILAGSLCISVLGMSIAYAAPKSLERKMLEMARIIALTIMNEDMDSNDNNAYLKSIHFKIGDPSDLVDELGEQLGQITMKHLGKTSIDAKRCCIALHPSLKDDNLAVQASTIFHELAHAYDRHLWKPGVQDTTFDCYPDLAQAVEYSKAKWKFTDAAMSASEWHADWQAIQWMKKYAPANLPALEVSYRELKLINDITGIRSMKYPPAEILLQWITSTK